MVQNFFALSLTSGQSKPECLTLPHSPLGTVFVLPTRLIRTNIPAEFAPTINDVVGKFYKIETSGQCYKTFYGRKLRLFTIS
jgi:hypothetical protein